ncbi:ATP-binding cassette sub-family A member 2-like isoform X3 [Apostichopus japonicus]|uniref:ATP-binding cassette sub-family A member 2-like isoform X3 n=1 Tax=Stichopus japonicus TaxID=307972 RepID=UPI003AB69B11
MGFLHQLQVLLWKNYTLKKRNPLVVIFEIVIPLVLFFIIVAIRKNKPILLKQEAFFMAQPLPSAGIIPVMQIFCPKAVRDPYGFPEHPKSQVTSFLNQLEDVINRNKMFNEEFDLKSIKMLPDTFNDLIFYDGSIENKFANAGSFNLGSILKNETEFREFLKNNLSMSDSDADQIINHQMNTPEVYKILYGSEPRNVSEDDGSTHNYTDYQEFINRRFGGLNHGALYRHESKSSIYSVTGVLGILSGTPVGGPQSGSSEGEDSLSEGLVNSFEDSLFSPETLQDVLCNEETVHDLYNSDNQTDFNTSRSFADATCNREDSYDIFESLSNELHDQIDTGKVLDLLNITDEELSRMKNMTAALMDELERFILFQDALQSLVAFAEILPADSCPEEPPPPPPHRAKPGPDDPVYETTSPVPVGNVTLSAVNSTNVTESSNCSSPCNQSSTVSPPMALTTPSLTTPSTTTEPPPTLPPKPKDQKAVTISMLYKLWVQMQERLCGDKVHVNQEVIDRGDYKELSKHLTSIQKRSLGLLLYVLFQNPKIPYSPNTPDVNDLIDKASDFIYFAKNITFMAETWLNISHEVREYLHMNTTIMALEGLGKLEKTLIAHPEFMQNVSMKPEVRNFILNDSLISPPLIEQNLDVLDNVACAWLSLVGPIKWDIFVGFKNENDMVDFVLNKAASRNITVFASLVFDVDQDGNLPAHVVYKIRQNSSYTARTDLIRRRFWQPGSEHHRVIGYYTYGFVWLQDIVERAIIDKRVGRRVTEPGGYVEEIPYPCYLQDNFLFMIANIMPMIMVVSWVYYVAMLTRSIVYEKEQRLKEVMKMMGLSNGVHWVAWFITSMLQASVIVAAITAILHYGNILMHSNPVIVWITFTIFSASVIVFCFVISVFFSKAKLASACAGIIYFTTYVPCIYIQIREESLAYVTIPSQIKMMASIFSPTAFGLGARYFALYEIGGEGVHWNNLFSSPVEHDDLNLFQLWIILLVDTVLYAIIVWYVENVYPGSYGLPRPWYFPLQYSYWFSSSSGLTDGGNRPLSVTEEDQELLIRNEGITCEAEPSDLPLGVSIQNLTKIYKDGHKVAVNKLSLNMYEGQITSFLGHNGAGKTTTMSVLTGLFPPTSGTAKIYDKDIRTDMLQIRKSLGMCPQHNALFDGLTVEEHMQFYGLLKGLPKAEIKSLTDSLIQDIGLRSKRHKRVECLSGGMQRKLSVAVAFVGGSKTVILDEPTAGVDPFSRRAIWDLLLKYKEGRTILLSTHHMDEADVLGDRIAIISHGQLKCVGSSLFLKTTYGSGYKLTVVKKPLAGFSSGTSTGSLNSSFHSNCDARQVTRLIQRHVPKSAMVNETPQELTYSLPYEAVRQGQFPKLFAGLKEKRSSLDVLGFGLMDSTLEDVFLKVAEMSADSGQDHKTPRSLRNFIPSVIRRLSSRSSSSSLTSSSESGSGREVGAESIASFRIDEDDEPLINVQENEDNDDGTFFTDEGQSSHHLRGFVLVMNQFVALIIKRFHYIRRNQKSLFSTLLLPALYVTLAMSVALSAPHISDLPSIILSPSQYHVLEYPDSNMIPYINDAISNSREEYRTYSSISGDVGPVKIVSSLTYPAGIGASCVLKTPFNGTLDRLVEMANFSSINLTAQYFDSMCVESFQKGKPLSNYLPRTTEADDNDGWINQGNETDHAKKGSHSSHLTPEKICYCKEDGYGFSCPTNVGSPYPPEHKVITSDVLLDCNNRNLSEYMLYTTDKYRLHRYGALSLGNVRKFVPPQFSNDVPKLYRKIAVRNVAIAWHNDKGYHSLPTYVNVLNNAILRANLHPSKHGNPSGYGMTVINHPMNKTGWSLTDDFIQQESTEVLIAIFIIIAMSFVPASFVIFIVTERSSKAKLVQFLSGVSPLVYWTSNFFWDMMSYLVPAVCCISILKIFDIPAYASSTNLPAVILLFLLYGFSITPMMYPASFFFSVSSSAYVFLIVINLFTGITTIVGSFLLEIFTHDDPEVSESFQAAYNIVHNISLIFPNYCLGRGLMDLAFNDYMNEYFIKIGDLDSVQSPFRWEMMNRMYVVMAIEGFLAFVLVVLSEYGFFYMGRRVNAHKALIPQEDEDVLRERQRVLNNETEKDILVLKNLTKIYKTRKLGKHLAVDGLCLGVPPGECFGLLGVNGAGKTTTFKMLTGDERITGGNAFISNSSVRWRLHKNIGYCPQFDALFEELTAREHLLFYSRLKGIPRRQESKVVNWAIQKLALSEYADVPSGLYSGGNKRKLSTAIALIGYPPVIFMDEPTTGMDPHSRQFLWKVIQRIVKEGKSVVLTSHSMEECEALCNRMAIMVNARFKCLGSTQHLKNRFGDGYTITLKIKGDRPNLSQVSQWFSHTFPKAELKEEHYNVVQYSMKLVHVNLEELFTKLEDIKEMLSIEDYSVSQTTLDNVFVNFAKEQMDQQEEVLKDDTKRFRWRHHQDKTLDESDLCLDETEDDDEEFLLQYATFKDSRLTFDLEE